MWGVIAWRQRGQALVWVALLVSALFGMLALIVDLGLGMAQFRALQNAADAGVMNGAKLMAGSVGVDASGNVIYVSLANDRVHARAQAMVTSNRPAALATYAYSMAVQFLNCSNGSLGFTYSSDTALVNALGGTKLASTTTQTPNNSCSLRVHTQLTYPSLFAGVIGKTSQTVATKSTARISPTNPPTTITGLWPISRWTYNQPDCSFVQGTLCTFWDSQAPPGGNFKEAIDMSRYSQLVYPSPLRSQHIVDYDQSQWGNNGKTVDLPVWLRNGWQGKIFVDENGANCQDGASNPLNCANSKLEVYGGDTGNNMADQMKAYINDPLHTEGNEPGLGNFATLNVFMWRYGEQNINTSTDVGSPWTNTDQPNQLQRIILQRVRRFKFYTDKVSSSSVQGYFVSFFNDSTPQSGPPSQTANTVTLSE